MILTPTCRHQREIVQPDGAVIPRTDVWEFSPGGIATPTADQGLCNDHTFVPHNPFFRELRPDGRMLWNCCLAEGHYGPHIGWGIFEPGFLTYHWYDDTTPFPGLP